MILNLILYVYHENASVTFNALFFYIYMKKTSSCLHVNIIIPYIFLFIIFTKTPAINICAMLLKRSDDATLRAILGVARTHFVLWSKEVSRLFETAQALAMEVEHDVVVVDQTLLTGATYKGQISDDGAFNGRGVYISPRGVKYEGEFLNGEFHGQGVMTFPGKGSYKSDVGERCGDPRLR